MTGVLNMLLASGEPGHVTLSNVTATGNNGGSCSYSLLNDGSQTATNETLDDWVVPGAVASQYEVRFSNHSGDSVSGASFNTWLNLGTTRTVTLPVPTAPDTNDSASFDVEIGRAGAQTAQASATVTLNTVAA